MAHELEVWLLADHVGTLALVEGRLNFWYAPGWLSLPNAVALSCSLPLQVEPFDDHKARPYFAGLLPEGKMRRLLARQFQVSGQNDFALLDHIGGECAGAVTFLQPGQALPAPINPSLSLFCPILRFPRLFRRLTRMAIGWSQKNRNAVPYV